MTGPVLADPARGQGFSAQQAEAGVALGGRQGQVGGSIARGVVEQDQLEVRVRLGEEQAHGPRDAGSFIPRRDEDRDEGQVGVDFAFIQARKGQGVQDGDARHDGQRRRDEEEQQVVRHRRARNWMGWRNSTRCFQSRKAAMGR